MKTTSIKSRGDEKMSFAMMPKPVVTEQNVQLCVKGRCRENNRRPATACCFKRDESYLASGDLLPWLRQRHRQKPQFFSEKS